MNSTPPQTEALASIFGLYKAEWLNGQLFSLFSEPSYFPELKTNRPCVLIGGRGTGKTTVLRGLSYQGRFAFSQNDPAEIDSWTQVAMYHRVNPNRVTAFTGPELSAERWTRVFAHYMNLLLCVQLTSFLEWRRDQSGRAIELKGNSLERLCSSLHLDHANSLTQLSTLLDRALIDFEACINNIADGTLPQLSAQGAPIDIYTTELAKLHAFEQTQFIFLIDEYENFLDYQQIVANTLIKHSEGPYTFKIGVRELGWRKRETLNENERLVHPADYHLIDISEQFDHSRFKAFASKVCAARFAAKSQPETPAVEGGIEALFPGISESDEAELLGVDSVISDAKHDIEASGDTALQSQASELTGLELFFLWHWSSSAQASDSFINNLREYLTGAEQWVTRYGNYKYSYLFAIRKGKRGVRKHYAGWDTFCRLACGNIRYLLELVHQSVLLLNSDTLPPMGIDAKTQTKAAEAVGKKNLGELEGVSVDGARLTKLLLSLGRIFEVMAGDPTGHTPEVTQFEVTPPEVDCQDVSESDIDKLLRAAVMHLALVRRPGSKLTDESDTRAFDYMMHPIFAPFFVFSHRRKRKMKLKPAQLLGMIETPAATIREVLAEAGRSEEPPLPDQLELFQGFYHGNS